MPAQKTLYIAGHKTALKPTEMCLRQPWQQSLNYVADVIWVFNIYTGQRLQLTIMANNKSEAVIEEKMCL